MHKSVDQGLELIAQILEQYPAGTNIETVVCPPFPLLVPIRDALKRSSVKLGAQDVYYRKEGAFTGQVSAAMLRSAGCQYVIVGHSERRQYFNEDDNTVALKLRAALDAGLTPIMCIGERLEERKAKVVFDVVDRQLRIGMSALSAAEVSSIVIAYEPVWAIGTGETATPAQAQEVHQFIRSEINRRYGLENAGKIRILYGGSVKPGNAAALFAMPDIDGGLIGGACLNAIEFIQIVQAAEQK